MGINLGDIIKDGRDIYGDGVNAAARLEALAEPGGICVSRVVRDQLRDKLPYQFADLGERSVKNITRPVRVYALRPEAIAELPASSVPPVVSNSQPAVAPRLSIVVLRAELRQRRAMCERRHREPHDAALQEVFPTTGFTGSR